MVLSFSELSSMESTESIEFVEDYFLVIFISKQLKIVFYKFCRFFRQHSLLSSLSGYVLEIHTYVVNDKLYNLKIFQFK